MARVPEDHIDHSDRPAQKFWSIYVDEATKHDSNLTDTWKADMDSTLIFVGLFSATVTAFIIESYKLLQPNTDTTSYLLAHILANQITPASNNSSALLISLKQLENVPKRSPSAVIINVLWFLSLAFSLTAALVITLVQQWIRGYLQRIQRHGQPQRRGRARHFLFAGVQKWRLEAVVEYVPTLLHLSLFLFFAGLCVFLSQVDILVAWFVLCIFVCGLAGYALVTIAPLLDASAPYETPLSFVFQSIRRTSFFVGRGLRDYPLKVIRERAATASNPNGDIQALLWTYKRITDDRELELFVTSIPGFLGSVRGHEIWWSTFNSDTSRSLTVELSIAHLLKTLFKSEDMEPDTKRKGVISCLDALFSIFCSEGHLQRRIGWTTSIDEDSYDEFHLLFSDLIHDLRSIDWDVENSLVLKASAILALSHRPPRIAGPFKQESSPTLHDMSHRADKALKDLTLIRQQLEETIRAFRADKSQPKTSSIANLEGSLRAYIDTLNSSSLVLSQWMRLMRDTVQKNRWLSLLEWYSQLPLPSPVITTILLPDNLLVNHQSRLDLYAVWMMAVMRRSYVYHPLPNFEDSETSTSTPETQDGQSRPLRRFSIEDHLLRELQPMILGFKLLPASTDKHPALSHSLTLRIKELSGDKDQQYISWPSPRHHKPGFFFPMGRHTYDQMPPQLMDAVSQRPFSMFTSIIYDGIEGSRSLSLLTLLSTLMHSRKSFSSEESPVIKKTLQLLFTNAKGTRITEIEASMESCGVKEGTLFFYSVFADVLTWERTLYSQDKYCPLSCELQRLNQMIIYVTLIRGKLTDMEFADAFFRGGGSKRLRSERHIRDMWDVRLNAAAICKHIRTQRSLLLQGKGSPPQDAHDGGTDSKTQSHEG